MSCMLEGEWRKINPCKTQWCCDSQAKLVSELEQREWCTWGSVSPQLGFFFFFLRVLKSGNAYIPCCQLGIESYRIQDHLINSCSEGPPWHMNKMNNVDCTLFNEQNYFQIAWELPCLTSSMSHLGAGPPFSSWKKIHLRSAFYRIRVFCDLRGQISHRVRASSFLRQFL